MAALRRRSSTWLSAAGLAPAAAIALMPKCPACAAVDVGALGYFFAAFTRAPQSLVLALSVILSGAGAFALGRRSRKRNGVPSAPAQAERAAGGTDGCAASGIS
jgi:hypothetical protein